MRDHKVFFMGAGSVSCMPATFAETLDGNSQFPLGSLWDSQLFGSPNGHRGDDGSGSTRSYLDV